MNRNPRRSLLSLSLLVFVLLLAACGRSPSPDGAAALEPATIELSGALFSSDQAAVDQLGSAVAIDGTTLLAGAPRHDHGASEDGAVYVYDLGVAGWTESAELTHPAPVDDAEFGASVDLLGDLAAVGAPGSEEVFTFARSAGSWVLQATFAVPGGGYGRSVALAEDLLVVGDDFDDDAGFNAGAIYVYEFDGLVWTQSAKLTGSGSAGGERIGYAVATNGERIVAGGVFSDFVYVFENDGSGWSETLAIANPSPFGATEFGVAVAVDGDYVVVGAPEDDFVNVDAGSAWAFRLDGGALAREELLLASDADPGDQFGGSVAIDGDYIAAGALFDAEGGASSGAAYVFYREDLPFSTSPWTEVEKFVKTGTLWLGDAVDISGAWSVVGSPRDATVGFQAGAAWPIDLATTLPAPTCEGLPATIHPLDPGPGGVVANAAGGFDITGTGAADVIVGSGGPDTIQGLDGADVICALGDDDTVSGGRRGDTIVGGSGHLDALFGNRGPDTLIDEDGTATMRGGAGDDTLDVLIPSGWNGGSMLFTDVRGGYGNDTVTVENEVAGITVQISGDELDVPPDPREGGADVFVLIDQAVDPGSTIIKFP